MLKKEEYQYICHAPGEIPEQVYSNFRREIGGRLGQPVSKIFPDFANAFPLTVLAMEKFWSAPMACFRQRQVTKNWLCALVMEQPERNLFFDLRVNAAPIAGEGFDRGHQMLPEKWKELYRVFESFVITTGSLQPMGWMNTPFNYSGRLDLQDFCLKTGVSKSLGRSFRKKVGSDRLVCWMLTEAGDALFIDEANCDHKVYHVCKLDMENYRILNDPEVILDQYLAHYVSGGSPITFDFDRD